MRTSRYQLSSLSFGASRDRATSLVTKSRHHYRGMQQRSACYEGFVAPLPQYRGLDFFGAVLRDNGTEAERFLKTRCKLSLLSIY